MALFNSARAGLGNGRHRLRAPLAQAQGAAVGAPTAQVKHFGAKGNTSFFRGGRTVFGPLTAEETATRGAAMAGAAFVVAVLMITCGRRGLDPRLFNPLRSMTEQISKYKLALARLVVVLMLVFIVLGLAWYGFSADVRVRIWQNLFERPGGPMVFRFILQPIMASIAAFRDGLKDARSGRAPFSRRS